VHADSSDAPPLMKAALKTLRSRSQLYNVCLEDLAVSRRQALSKRFLLALTRGGPNGHPKAIEMHAHDPQRYIADMLAWVHQSLASERELLTALFSATSDDPAPPDREASGLSLSLSLSLSFSLSLLSSLSLSSLSLSFSLSHTHTLSLSISLSHTHTRAPPLGAGADGVGRAGGVGGAGVGGVKVEEQVVLASIMEAVCPTLQARIESVLTSSSSSVTVFKVLRHLISCVFYFIFFKILKYSIFLFCN
jgi:hypothetical protein